MQIILVLRHNEMISNVPRHDELATHAAWPGSVDGNSKQVLFIMDLMDLADHLGISENAVRDAKDLQVLAMRVLDELAERGSTSLRILTAYHKLRLRVIGLPSERELKSTLMIPRVDMKLSSSHGTVNHH